VLRFLLARATMQPDHHLSDHTRWNPTPPGGTPTPEPTPKRRVLLFEFACSEHQYRCELLDHDELGVEAQFSKNGEFLEGRLFETMQLAARWAGARRKAFEARVA
jgi:hypothetical protein